MSLSPVQFRLVTLLNQFGGKSLWEGNLIVYQVAAGSTPVAIAYTSRIRLLARAVASQAHALEIETPKLCGSRREVRFLAFPLDSRPWCNGSTADSKPVSQGSNPWGRAGKGCRSLGRRGLGMPATPDLPTA